MFIEFKIRQFHPWSTTISHFWQKQFQIIPDEIVYLHKCAANTNSQIDVYETTKHT
jgi:hypothetical protein